MSNSKTKARVVPSLLALCVLVTTSGCDEAYDAQVSGHVTLDGELLRAGTVLFYPADGSGASAYSQINRDGSYALRTGMGDPNKPGAGSLASGEYLVTVVSHGPMAQGIGERGGPPDPGPLVTPAKYGDTQTTDLEFTVTPGRNLIVLELERDIEKTAEVEGEEESELDTETEPSAEQEDAAAEESETDAGLSSEGPAETQPEESGDDSASQGDEATPDVSDAATDNQSEPQATAAN